ncbi:MAG: ATP-binding cassette domain-containing protein [Candidatus Methanosuratus sp.]|nr:ATP-binding cassette domain-containing protein [Candidatus Methanosuratincola sp.]
MKAISVHDLTKVFGSTVAVDHISFDTEEGEIFGLIGLNGAGKTTTILMLTTLLNPTSGTATVCGYDILKEKDSIRRSIGVVFEEQAVDIYLTGRQNLDFSVRMYNVPAKERRERITNALEAIGLADFADVKVKDYSGGMLRRLEIARAMLTNPKVLFLDEPTIGVDVQTRRYLWDYLRRVNKELGMTIFISTSYLEEADYLCNRVALIDEGKLIATGTPEELKASIGKNLVSIKVATGINADFVKLLQGLDYVEKIEERDGSLELSLKNGSIGIPDIVRLARRNGFTISSISSHNPSLNDVLLHYTGKKAEG